jgi:iron complex outermembrane receptor protein
MAELPREIRGVMVPVTEGRLLLPNATVAEVISYTKPEPVSGAPTWLLGLDYKPMDDLLLYAKWSRGYRQGGVASFGADKLQDYGSEKVDTYEAGSKFSWQAVVPGYFNLAVFYNDFTDQQLQLGLQCKNTAACSQTTAILNAGKSTLEGFELETGIVPFKGLRLDAAYAYLKTEVKEIIDAVPLVQGAGLPFDDIRTIPVGAAIPNSIPHKVTAGITYTLPLPESVGKISAGSTFVYQSQYRAVTDAVPGSNNGVLPQARWFNLNFGWNDIVGLPLDASVFVTNVNNEKIYLHLNDQQTGGFASYFIGEPRMWGARVRYKFGG